MSHDKVRQCKPQLLTSFARGFKRTRRQQDTEFLTTHATEHVVRTQLIPTRCNDLLQGGIACRMPILVVDHLEMIQVAQYDTDFLLHLFAVSERCLCQFDEV